MSSRFLFPSAFCVLLIFGAYRHIQASRAAAPSVAAAMTLRTGAPPDEPGTFPDEWIRGLDCGTEPQFQVHPYNDNLVILRQGKCQTFEAPFLYLIFGDEKALLMDTGSNGSNAVYETVNRVIDRWLEQNGRDSIPLIVAHTHSHGDHIQGDGQFVNKPNVETVVGLTVNQVVQFWGFQDFPNDQVQIDLGNRVIDVFGTPGHQAASITLYDHRTHLLLTGDIVYPGHLFVFSPGAWPNFLRSLRRLAIFASQNPVEWVVGCHIEMSDTPFGSFAWGTGQHPTEHVLQLPPSEIIEIYLAALGMGNNPQCEIFDDFVIHPVYLCGITWNG